MASSAVSAWMPWAANSLRAWGPSAFAAPSVGTVPERLGAAGSVDEVWGEQATRAVEPSRPRPPAMMDLRDRDVMGVLSSPREPPGSTSHYPLTLPLRCLFRFV